MRKLTRPVRKVNAQVIGLDVHKLVIAFCVLDRGGREIAEGRIRSDREDLEALLEERVGRKRTHFALEASGCSLWVYDLLVERNGPERVHMGHAKAIRAIANSRTKNDANDAFWLAYLTHEGRLPEAYVPESSYRELRLASRERIEAVRRRTRLVNRLRGLAAQQGRRVRGSFRTVATRERFAALATQSPGAHGQAMRGCLEEIVFQERRIKEWERRMDELVGEIPEVEAIGEEIPGCGRVLAATIVAESGPPSRFRSARAYGGYTGLPPSDRSSGGRQIHGSITREGSPYLRWALVQAVMGCCRARRGPGFAVGEWVRALEQRMGGLKRKARCAAARKLAETIWRLFHYGECFDASRAFRLPRQAAA